MYFSALVVCLIGLTCPLGWLTSLVDINNCSLTSGVRKKYLRVQRTIDNLQNNTSFGGRAIPLPPSDNLSDGTDMNCDNEINIELLSPSISQDEIMEIILDKPSNLKRLHSTVSDDSTSSQSNGQKKESGESSIRVDAKKSKMKKKNPLKSVHGTIPNIVNDDVSNNTVWYKKINKGPYIVFVRKLGDRSTTKAISTIEAERLLSKANINYTVIEFHSWNTWKISFTSYQDTNAAVKNKFLPELGLIIYIPKYRIYRKGVIKYIPVDIPLEEIQTNLKMENDMVHISNIFRLKRKDPLTKKWVDSQSVCVEFRNQELPKNIKL